MILRLPHDLSGQRLPAWTKWYATWPSDSIRHLTEQLKPAFEYEIIKHAGSDRADAGERSRVPRKPLAVTWDSREAVQRLFDERRITIHARALKDSEPQVREAFGSFEELETEVKARLSKLPEPLLDYWRAQDRGNLELVANLPPHMVPPGRLSSLGAYDRARCEAVVSVASLALNIPSLEEEAIHLVDHLLGSKGLVEAETLSSGYAVSEALKPLAAEIYQLSQDPQAAISKYGQQNPREYLAAAIRLAWEFEDITELQQLYKQLYTVIVEKFLNREFWREKL